MATDAELDDARVLASLSRILNDGAPYVALPGVDPATSLPPDSMVDAIRAPLEAAITDLDELTTDGRLGESNLNSTFVAVEGEPADGDAIIWDDVAGQWVPAAVEGGGTALTVLSEAEGNTGTATTARAISAARLVQQIAQHAAAGAEGASAYDVAVAEGFVGDETAWLASLVGADGAPGADGADGAPGADGADGADGEGVPTGGDTAQVLAKASGADFDTEWVDQSGGGALFSPSPVVGNVRVGGWSTTTWRFVEADRIYFYPVYYAEAFSVDQLGCAVRGNEPSATVRFGLYDSQANGFPGAPVAETSVAGSSGWKQAGITTVGPLDSGWYWHAFLSTAAMDIHGGFPLLVLDALSMEAGVRTDNYVWRGLASSSTPGTFTTDPAVAPTNGEIPLVGVRFA